MKRLYFYIVGLWLIFNTVALAQPKIVLPEDFQGTATISKVEAINNDEDKTLTKEQAVLIIYEVSGYIVNKYTFQEVASDDFIEVLRKVFPQASETELQNRHVTIRNIYTTYNFLKTTYNKYVTQALTPKTIRRVRSYEDFDHHDDVSYIEAKEGHFIKVYNFKKFLTYSNSEDERRAIDEYITASKTKKNVFDYIDDIVHKIDWKKVWFYGSVYENPFLSKNGVGPQHQGKYTTAQLLSRNTYIDGHHELDFGYLLQNSPYTFILANDLDEQQRKPQIDLTGSENVAEYTVFYPAPLNAENIAFAHKYFGNFLLPFKIKPIDSAKPIKLKATIKFTSCSTFFECITESFSDEMTLEPYGDDIFDNGYDNMFANTLQNIPQPSLKQLNLVRFAIDEDRQQQILRLEFTSPLKIRSFKVFLEETDGFTKFDAPYISLQDNKVYARFEAFPDGKTSDFTNSEFTVTAVLNDRYYYRNKVYARPASDFDPQKPNLNFGLLLLAILGGLILNFMPCVFPVLSLKIVALYQTTKQERKVRQKNMLGTVIGIFCGFTLLIIALVIAKYLGHLLGWGMQFQNMGFLVTMIFILSTFIILFPSVNFSNLSTIFHQKQSAKLNFLIGNLIVLLSTPCTGPYLATVIGFALSGTYMDIICILYAVSLGLSLPYLVLMCVQNPQNFLPKSGNWMNTLHWVTKIMLYLTILWFLSLLWGQTGKICTLKILILLAIFLFIFHIYQLFIDYLSRSQDGTQAELNKIRKGAHIFILVVFAGLTALATYIANNAYNKQYEQNISQRNTNIDMPAIQGFLNKGHPVLLEIKADWCMTCQVNNILMFNKLNLDRLAQVYHLEYIQVDWTNYNEQILNFMARYGRKGLPFYVLFTPYMREGLVLPEIFSNQELERFIAAGLAR